MIARRSLHFASLPVATLIVLAARAAHADCPPSPGSAPASPLDSPCTPASPPMPATTHPQPPDRRVWRLVDPAETDWRSLDPNRPRGWARVDTDGTGLGAYVGGSFRIDDALAFAPFVHDVGTVVEPNVALTWTVGPLWLMPAFGTSLDFGATRALSLDPQLFLAADAKALYFEAWLQYFWATAYHVNAVDTFASRVMLLFSVSGTLGLGVEYDATDAPKVSPTLISSIFGGRTNVRIGDQDTVGLFVGYQTVWQARLSPEGVAGRFEYVHQW